MTTQVASSRETIHSDIQSPRCTDPPEVQVQHLAQLLRFVGAMILVAAASVFLVQNWGRGNDISRYTMLLGYTGLMTVSAFLCGLKIRESKGARTLLGLVSLIMPVHFAVLGGLLYSRFPLDRTFITYEPLTRWVAPSSSAAVLTVLCAVPVLAGLIFISLSALTRANARMLTVLYLSCNATLLLPFRSANVTAWLTIGMLAGIILTMRRSLRRELVMETFEGYWVRGILWLPALLFLGRQYYLYSGSPFLSTAVWGGLTLLSFLGARLFQGKPRTLLQAASAFPALIACFFFVVATGDVFNLSGRYFLPLFAICQSIPLLTMSMLCAGPGLGYRRVAIAVGACCLTGNLLLFPGVGPAFALLVFGIAMLGHGAYAGQRFELAAGAAGAVIGLGYHVRQAIHLYSWGNWGSLAVLGLVIILAASYLEKNHLELLQGAMRFQCKLKKRGES